TILCDQWDIERSGTMLEHGTNGLLERIFPWRNETLDSREMNPSGFAVQPSDRLSCSILPLVASLGQLRSSLLRQYLERPSTPDPSRDVILWLEIAHLLSTPLGSTLSIRHLLSWGSILSR